SCPRVLVGFRFVTVAAECSVTTRDSRRQGVWNSPREVGRMTFIVWNEWFTVHQLQRHNVVPFEDPWSVLWEKPGAR
ncbi:hypothetical protein L195_g056013, partial [Trifolium pratense]